MREHTDDFIRKVDLFLKNPIKSGKTIFYNFGEKLFSWLDFDLWSLPEDDTVILNLVKLQADQKGIYE